MRRKLQFAIVNALKEARFSVGPRGLFAKQFS